MSPQIREKTLEKEAILFRGPAENLSELESLRDPFMFYAPPVEAAVEQAVAEAAPAAPVRIADAEALQVIARSFRPKGSLISGTRRLLVMPQGQNVPMGSSFSATINDQVYDIEIADIDSSGYTLRLNKVTLHRTFDDSQRQGNPLP